MLICSYYIPNGCGLSLDLYLESPARNCCTFNNCFLHSVWAVLGFTVPVPSPGIKDNLGEVNVNIHPKS